MVCKECGNEISGYCMECPFCKEKRDSEMQEGISYLREIYSKKKKQKEEEYKKQIIAEYVKGTVNENLKWKDKITKAKELHEKNVLKWSTVQDYGNNLPEIAIRQEKYVIETLNKLLNKE